MRKILVLLIPVFKMNRRSHLGIAGSRFQEGWSGSIRKINSATCASAVGFCSISARKSELASQNPA